MANQKIGFMDVLAFAKAGYTPKDVREIMAMAESAEEAPTPAVEEVAKNEVQKDPEVKQDDSPTPDYKAMFEAQQKQLDELKSKLDAAQKANIASDVSQTQTKVSASETINNIFRDVIS